MVAGFEVDDNTNCGRMSSRRRFVEWRKIRRGLGKLVSAEALVACEWDTIMT